MRIRHHPAPIGERHSLKRKKGEEGRCKYQERVILFILKVAPDVESFN
eukprot:gene5483-3957_t